MLFLKDSFRLLTLTHFLFPFHTWIFIFVYKMFSNFLRTISKGLSVRMKEKHIEIFRFLLFLKQVPRLLEFNPTTVLFVYIHWRQKGG